MNGTKNLARDGNLQSFNDQACSPSFVGGLQQQSINLSVANILLSLTAFLGNSVILVVLRPEESSLHPPSKLLYRCLATTDLLVGLVCQPLYATYWMSVSYEHWSLCRFAYDAFSVSAYALCSVSLLTMAAISVDRLLALLLGLRYRVLVTLKRTYIILATFWVLSGFTAICYLLDYRIATWNSILFIPSCLSISLVSYTKIFRTLSHHQAQVQDHAQQQPNQPNALNIARYRKAVYSALWVQLAFVVCYVPFTIVETVNALSKTYSSHLVINWGIALSFLYCNSTAQTKTSEEIGCSPSSEGGLQQQSIYFSAVNILLSITALLGNSLILVALRKVSSLHPTSKLLYRCLATTDLLVGLVSQPLYATYWMSIVYEHWNLCPYIRDAAFITSYGLCGVSLSTVTAISVDRLLVLLLGLKYQQTVTLKRTRIVLATFW
ncbi:unnamed protein product, partial [Pocillopora meandrina]